MSQRVGIERLVAATPLVPVVRLAGVETRLNALPSGSLMQIALLIP